MKNMFFFVLIFLGLPIANGCSVFVDEYVVNIKSYLINDNVTLNYQSRDGDLGYHVLRSPNLVYEWSFCQAIGGYTLLFSCHFWRKNVEQVFDVFNATLAPWCYQYLAEGNTCNWEIKEDGNYFYFDHETRGRKYA